MKTIAITGEKRTGKSTLIRAIKEKLQETSNQIDGLLSLPVIENDELLGFDILHLRSNSIVPLARKGLQSEISTARFGFYPNSFSIQNRIINSNNNFRTILLLDEIGILELRDLGWHNLILDIKSQNYKGVVLVIRKSSFFDIIKKYHLKFDIIVDLDSTDFSLDMLLARLTNYMA